MLNFNPYVIEYLEILSSIVKFNTNSGSLIEIFGEEFQGKTFLSSMIYCLYRKNEVNKNILISNPLQDETYENLLSKFSSVALIDNNDKWIDLLEKMFFYYKFIIIDDAFAMVNNKFPLFLYKKYQFIKCFGINIIVITAQDTTKLPQAIESKSHEYIKSLADIRLYIRRNKNEIVVTDIKSHNKVRISNGNESDIRCIVK